MTMRASPCGCVSIIGNAHLKNVGKYQSGRVSAVTKYMETDRTVSTMYIGIATHCRTAAAAAPAADPATGGRPLYTGAFPNHPHFRHHA